MSKKSEKAARVVALKAEAERLKAEGMELPPEEAAELAADEADGDADEEDGDEGDKEEANKAKPESSKPRDPTPDEIAKVAGKLVADAEKARNPTPGPEVALALENARKAPIKGTEAMRSLNEPTVTMSFARKVLLTLGDHSRIEWEAGIQEVPESLSTHRTLKLYGVKKYVK